MLSLRRTGGARDGGTLFVDIDDPERLPPEDLPETLTVTSGSARGYHLTYRNDGEVANSKATGDLHGAGEVRASNWYVVLPGSVHLRWSVPPHEGHPNSSSE
ncbi:hypothetical protein D8S78_07240 [Natrialba swarupiae]|nr:hypothetical protein [Natrialba swarupiae]